MSDEYEEIRVLPIYSEGRSLPIDDEERVLVVWGL